MIQKVIQGLTILAKYGDHVAADHDQIWAGPDVSGVLPDEDKITKEDKKQLKKLGWFVDPEAGIWSKFV
jgi:hypothetical protein